MTSKVYIGGGAGFAGDRTDAAGPVVDALATLSGARFLMFETLAERTLALSQVERRRDPTRGYNPALDRFIGPVLARCLRDKIRIVGNFGAANPRGAAERILALAQAQKLPLPRIAIVEGDDLSGSLSKAELAARETGGACCKTIARSSPPIFISARNRSRRRSMPARISWSPAASPIPLWRSVR